MIKNMMQISTLTLLLFIQTSCYSSRFGKWYTRDNTLVDTKSSIFLNADYTCLREAQQPVYYSIEHQDIIEQNSSPALNGKQRMAAAFTNGFNKGYGGGRSVSYIKTNTTLYDSCMGVKGFFWVEDERSKMYFGY